MAETDEHDIIVYVDEDGTTRSVVCDITDISTSWVRYKTSSGSDITLSQNRVVKIKHRRSS